MTGGIRKNLVRAFLAVIGGLSLTMFVLLAINYQVVRQYRALSETMIAEYRLIDSLSGLVAAYNAHVISTGVDEANTDRELQATRAQVAELTAYLDGAIVDTRSRVSYLGLKNSIGAVTSKIDESLQNIARGDIQSFTEDYYEANKRYQFVRENGTKLIFDELNYASSILGSISRTYQLSQALGVLTLILIVGACAVYVLRFARRMTAPISRLEQLALRIAKGELDVAVDADLMAKQDELGSLARSFQTMTAELNKANVNIKRSQEQVKERADQLERMNKLMVGRELKMVELKKQLERLKPPRL